MHSVTSNGAIRRSSQVLTTAKLLQQPRRGVPRRCGKSGLTRRPPAGYRFGCFHPTVAARVCSEAQTSVCGRVRRIRLRDNLLQDNHTSFAQRRSATVAGNAVSDHVRRADRLADSGLADQIFVINNNNLAIGGADCIVFSAADALRQQLLQYRNR